MGNTQSIPSFSIPCLEAKSFAVSSCRFAQSSPIICANFRRKIESQKKQNVKVLKTKAPPKTFPTGGASRRGSFFPNLPPRGRGTAAAAVRRAANLISYSCQWQLYHNLWMRGVAGVSCRKYARSKGAVRKVCRCEPVTDVTGVAAPRLDGNSLVLRPRCLKIRGIATPACALVRNDRAFSNSPFDCLFLTAPAQNAPPQSGLTPCQLPRRGSFFPNLPPRGRGTAAAAVRRAANLISYSCQWQLYHNLWMRGVAGVSCRKYARSKAPLQGELARRSRD